MFDIKRINCSFKNVHSRYYIDTNGVVYTSISRNTKRIMVKGKVLNMNKFRNDNLSSMNNTTRMLIEVPNTNHEYYMLNDGSILQRLKTTIKNNNEVYVCLILIDGNSRGNYKLLSRLVAGSFLGDVTGKEVHHKDRDRTNNKISNLEILTKEEHRGKGNFRKHHPSKSND